MAGRVQRTFPPQFHAPLPGTKRVARSDRVRRWLKNLAVVCGLLLPQAVGAQVYNWVDEHGTIQLRDRDRRSARAIPRQGS